GLRVPDGKSLLLVGGNINLDGGSLRAYEGNVELASVSAPGSMGLDIFGDTFGLNVSEDVQKGDISIANESNISIFGKFGGNIVINARNFEISNSFIFAGSLQKEGNPEAQAGDVNINATDSILLKDGAFIDNSVYSQGNAGDIFLKASNSISLVDRSLISNNIEAGGIGKGGNINITAGSLSLTKDSEIQALLRRADVENNLPSEQGNLGNIFLQTSNSVSLVNSNIFNSIEAGGIGNGGNINITAGSLSLIDGSEIQARLDNADVENNLPGGQGNVGNITVNVRDTVTIAGIKDGIGSDISNFVGTDAIGNAGDININADSLSLAEASEINAKTLGQGNAGNITVNARQNISLDGSGDVTLSDGSNRIRPTRIISFVNPEAVGNAGDIQLNTETLSVTNEALISSSTTGKGNAGNITINAKNTVTFDTSGYADSVVGANVIGNAGDIRVTTRALSLTNGGQLSSSVLGSGNAGNIFVEARDSVQLDGLVGNAFSGIQSNLLTEGVGNGGDIQITTGVLSVTNGAKISANTSGQGDAGNITLNVRDQVNFDGFDTNTGFFSQVSTLVDSNGVGNGGDIRVNTGELLLKNGANILTVNSGKGNAGDIFLDVRDTITFDGRSSNTFLGSSIFRIPSAASSYADNGNAGNIEVKTGSLFLTNGGLINAGAFPDENSSDIANGGNIIINARDTIKFDGASSGLNSTLLRGTGKGGDIQITTGSLSVTNGAFLGAFTNGRGNAGNININARDTVTFDGHSSFAYTLVLDRGIGDAGDIEITTGSLFLNNGASFSTLTAGKGDAGEIQIDTANSISLSNSSFITSNVLPGGEGKGGEIDISAQTLTLTGKSEIAVSSNGIGDAGDIEVQAETLQLDNGFIRAQTASTQGGDINLELSEKLVLRNSSQITTTAGTAQAEGDGGNISINSPFIVALPNENSDITANAFTGNGGNVDIVIQGIFGITPAAKPTLQSDITASSETGIQGEISVTDPEINPSQGLIELPDGVVDKSNQIAQICPRGINAKKLS
ncbi:MAG: S-layer family protein, partial [Cyanobacteria bacterium P01_D01_bin.116]